MIYHLYLATSFLYKSSLRKHEIFRVYFSVQCSRTVVPLYWLLVITICLTSRVFAAINNSWFPFLISVQLFPFWIIIAQVVHSFPVKYISCEACDLCILSYQIVFSLSECTILSVTLDGFSTYVTLHTCIQGALICCLNHTRDSNTVSHQFIMAEIFHRLHSPPIQFSSYTPSMSAQPSAQR